MQHLLTILLLAVTLAVSAQTKSTQQSPSLTYAEPASVGMAAERLARIDAMAKEAIEDNEVPGLVALVARRGKIIFHKAFGTADLSGRKLERDAIFRIASQTKAVTATAVMMLWEEGLFRLDDPISNYIPEFKNPQVIKSFRYADTSYTTKPAENEITIRHLLTHTSGLGYGFIDGDERFKMIYQKAGIVDAFTTDNITIEENIKKLAKLPLHFNPGEKYSYAEGLDVLGYFVEIMSGQPFDEFLREHLFEPLGMNDTWFYLPSNKANQLVAVQRWNDNQWKRYSGNGYDADYPVKGEKTFFSGGAGLSSTAKDYATFLQMYLNGGELNGMRILSRTTVQSMMGNQIGNLWEGQDRYYGLAFGVLNQTGQDQGGRGSIGTFDWGGYFNTQYFADPQEELIGILMKQTRGGNGDDTGWKFRILVNQAVDD
ncbi:MAG: serine hydrolase domain-containing protein [Tunicatimonas sp.]|uniref:serine hydrolase domain-containing protein n=1 Tax=Tunicatimonas sp. TaxID=1940096 RepID=UPI003C73866C